MSALRARRIDLLERQAARLRAVGGRLTGRAQRLSWFRLAAVLAGVTAILVFYWLGWREVVWVAGAAFLVLFIALALRHLRVQQAATRARVLADIKDTHLARMRHEWSAIPEHPPASVDARHPFAQDLDVVGPRSLYHLLDTATSLAGSQRLLGWLIAERVEPAVVRARQALVRQLIPRWLFRDRLELSGKWMNRDPRAVWDGSSLLRWLDEHRDERSLAPALWLCGSLAVVHALSAAAARWTELPPLWPWTWVAYFGVYMAFHDRLRELFHDSMHLQMSLERFRWVAACLEREAVHARGALGEQLEPYRRPGRRPSAELGSITRIAGLAGLQQNQVLWFLVNALVPWDMIVAVNFQRCKRRIAAELPEWLESWHEIEAAASLANFAYLNPAHAFPEIDETPGAPPLVTRDLGHPLLDDATRISNSLTIERLGKLLIVTGSNMSGKSTFLRTVGINLCLTFAGGVVLGGGLRTIPLRLFTCINVSDSVNDGISYFYAEVRRLKALLEALRREGDEPLLYLIDEIFRGTNNRERMQGTRAYVRAVVGERGIGLISTHDLELVHLAEATADIANYHFRETVAEGRMVFDYRLRDGPCPTTNAIQIMRLEGLPVPEDAGG